MAGYSDAITDVREFSLLLINEKKLGLGDHIWKQRQHSNITLTSLKWRGTHPYDCFGGGCNLGEYVEVKDDGHLGVQWVHGSTIVRLAVGVARLAQAALKMLKTVIQVRNDQSTRSERREMGCITSQFPKISS